MTDSKVVLAGSSGLSRQKWECEEERTGFSDLICMGTADMDFKSPEAVLQALRQVLDRGHLGYPYITDRYYDAIHDWLLRTGSWEVDARNCVANNVGIYMAAWNALDVLTVPGDRIAVLTPVHFCFQKMISMNDRVVVECPLAQKNGNYVIDYQYLEACLKSNVKMLWLCNPHNPVGRAWTKEELEKIGTLCVENDVLIMSDDVYCGLLFPGVVYTPIASLSKEISSRTITLYSTSKCYNTTGLRHSFIVTENIETFMKYDESLTKCDLNYGVNIMGIEATIAAFNECDEWLSALMKQVEKNHELVAGYFTKNMPGAVVAPAEAAYFAWVDMRALGIDPQQLSYLIEQEEHMIVENGVGLGKGGSGFIRMNLATTEENLHEGVKRLKRFWERHK